jgi:hypothetical protein
MIVDKLFGTATSPALAGNDQAVDFDLVLTHTITAPGHKLPLKTKAHLLRDPDRLSADVLQSVLGEKTREAAKCYRHQSLIVSTVVAGSAFTLGSSRLSQS